MRRYVFFIQHVIVVDIPESERDSGLWTLIFHKKKIEADEFVQGW
jgi:hypothetical protein